jgi:hypothetical protein
MLAALPKQSGGHDSDIDNTNVVSVTTLGREDVRSAEIRFISGGTETVPKPPMTGGEAASGFSREPLVNKFVVQIPKDAIHLTNFLQGNISWRR